MDTVDIFLKAEHHNQVDTRLAWTAIKFAPNPFTTGWYKAIRWNLSMNVDSTAPVESRLCIGQLGKLILIVTVE